MSDDAAPSRATVREVDAKVATVAAKVDGLRDLIQSEGQSTRDILEPLRDVPEDVATLKAEHDALEQRVADLEAGHTRALNWKALAAISLGSSLLGGGLSHIPHF